MKPDRHDTFPVSYAQQRMWVLDRMLPAERAVYNVGQVLRLRGTLDVRALSEAFTTLVLRHESLRTRFMLEDGVPVQSIAPPMSVELTVEQMSAAQALERAGVEAHTGFDLEAGPLWRVRLYRVSGQEHWLQVTLHHIVTDGWSMGVLVREVSQLYAAYARGEGSPLAGLPVQYADYAVWQRRWLQGKVLERQVAYWREALAGVPELALAADRRRPAVSSYRGGVVEVALPAALVQGLKGVGRGCGATLFMTLLAGYALLLSRYSGQEDVAVGVPTAGRTRAEVEGLIGFFVNTLVLRTDLSGAPTFAELVGRVRERALGAFAHQDVPFEKLVEELSPKRDLSRNPLFQASMVLHNTPPARWELPGLVVEAVEGVEGDSAKFDLSLMLRERDGALVGSMEYASDLFEAASVQRMVDSLRVLLEAAVADPQRPITALPLLSEAQREAMLAAGRGAQVVVPERCVHELVAAQALRTPQAVAVVHGDRRVTYAELEGRANRLAHRLVELGVGPEVLVGLCVARSVELVVGMLGILKAGGAYVPLDPGYPVARLRYMLEDAAAPVLVARGQVDGYAGRLVDVDEVDLEGYPDAAPPSAVTPRNLAYVIYTSGSTGKPKGVMIEHRSLANHMAWMQREFPLEVRDRVLQKTPISADAAVWEFYAPLLVGATLVMAEPDAHRAPSELVDAVRRHEISVLQLVPAMLAVILDHPGFGGCGTLRRLFCGGEALKGSLVRRFREQSRAQVVNLYGPTEATIDATSWVCDAAADDSPVPIGRPIDNLRAYVLDRGGEPVPCGVRGELHLAGEGIARGYWRREADTAARFVADAFVAGERMYRTGDEARVLPGGVLEFLGRCDRQVKIGGVRVELEEIESVLAGMPGFSDAVVVLDESRADSPRIVAYVVAAAGATVTAAGATVTAADMNAHMRAQLPLAMLPSLYVRLDSLPRLPNGKVDRARLPVPSEEAVASPVTAIQARDPVEEEIVRVMREVLARPAFGVDDDFFVHGGHSLGAAQVLARLEKPFGVALPMREFFANPTAAAVAAQVKKALAHGDSPTPALWLSASRGKFPVSYAQQRMWLLDRMLPTGLAVYNVGQVVRLRGVLQVRALSEAFTTLASRHESLRTRFVLEDGVPMQSIAPPMSVELTVEQVSAEEALAQARREARTGFDLEAGPLWRVRLYRVSEQEHWLQVTLHHIVTDGWSMGVLVREVSQLYAAYVRGGVSPLAGLPVQYADYAVWQRRWLQGEVLERQVGYWREALAGVPELALAADRRRPAVSSYRGGVVEVALPAALVQGLKGVGRGCGATLFMTLLAGYALLLSRYSGQEDVAVGVPTAGRTRAEVEGLIGFFVNTLVLRTDLSGAPTFAELVGRVRERALGAFAHQDVPFEKLVEELSPKRDLSRNPLFQASMVLHNTPPARWELPGLEVEAVEGVRGGSAKFDLSLTLRERDGALVGSMEYASDLFEASSVQRMVDSLRVLLEAAVADPQCSIAALPLLSEAQREKVLAAGMGAQVAIPERCVHELVAAQALRTPQAVAVVHGDRRVTYAELEGRANRLAHRLVELGVGPEVLVGLCMARSVELVVGMLGILKAGGAYVPLDPGYPVARLRYMLEDACAPVLVARGEVEGYAGRVVDVDGLDLEGYPDDAPRTAVTPRNLAYVIYTSGSTGKPKGVMVEHRSIVALTNDPDYVPIRAGDTIAHASNVAFDAVTFEIWGALVNGARIAILDPDDVLTAPALASSIERRRIDCMFLTTALFNEIARADATAFRGLRHLLFGGEAHDPARVREVVSTAPPGRLLHVYGPTETTTFATYHEVTRDDRERVPIGRAIGGTSILLLDEAGAPVPPHVAGEIHIAGAGVARGYLNRPQETAARFVEHPTQPGERVYRSGDLARWNGCARLEYIGRSDEQVKLRGFRIEPAEIAAVIGEHPQVRACHVAARTQASGYLALVAYFISSRESGVTPGALARHAASHLPAYMVPSAWVEMDAFPLTANGKVDERALPESSPSSADAAPYAAPRNDTERMLCRLWSEALGVAQVGIDDDFFSIGGHSLLAARIFARMASESRCSLPLATLFECPTIRELAPRCAAAARAPTSRSLVAITRGSGPPIYLVPGVYGNVVGFADLARALGPDHPVYALQAPGLDGGGDDLPDTIEAIARRYLGEIRGLQAHGPYAFGGACFGATVAYEMARQAMADGSTVACLVLLDPTVREGKEADRRSVAVPRPLARAASLGRFAWGRLALYREELQKVPSGHRAAYVAGKLRVVAGRMRDPVAIDVQREITEREVYRRNVLALDRYRRQPLAGDLRHVVIIETARGHHMRRDLTQDWCRTWPGEITCHVVGGKDSGDMISGRHARDVAGILARHLQAAFAAEAVTSE